ncbi:helix-turn-helix domain protein [Rhodococcus erythropolis]|nr:helix-turn-helix domain protein [Rhodococcus erythropolis]
MVVYTILMGAALALRVTEPSPWWALVACAVRTPGHLGPGPLLRPRAPQRARGFGDRLVSANAQFHEVVHAPTRLRICGLLGRTEELECAVVRDALELRDANLSKNLAVLAEAGLVSVRKDASEKRFDARRLTWVALTGVGREVVEEHLAALRAIAG